MTLYQLCPNYVKKTNPKTNFLIAMISFQQLRLCVRVDKMEIGSYLSQSATFNPFSQFSYRIIFLSIHLSCLFSRALKCEMQQLKNAGCRYTLLGVTRFWTPLPSVMNQSSWQYCQSIQVSASWCQEKPKIWLRIL